jgi:hypothetical protein
MRKLELGRYGVFFIRRKSEECGFSILYSSTSTIVGHYCSGDLTIQFWNVYILIWLEEL